MFLIWATNSWVWKGHINFCVPECSIVKEEELLESLELFCHLLSVSGLLLFKSNPHHSTSWLCYPSLWEDSGSPTGPVKLLGQVLFPALAPWLVLFIMQLCQQLQKIGSMTVGMDWAIGRTPVGKTPSGELRHSGRAEQLQGSEGVLVLSLEKLPNTFLKTWL